MSNSTPSILTVDRNGETFQLKAGQNLRPGDRITNTGQVPAAVGAVSYSEAHPSVLATLKPGSTVKVTDVGGPEDEVLGMEAVEGEVEVAETTVETAAASEYLITPEVDSVSGLFGAVPLLGGLAGPAAAALGLAALAAGGDDDDAGASGAGGGGGLGGGADGAVDTFRNGVSGLLDSAGAGLAETPLAPAEALTGALADGVNTVADQLAGLTANDPTGLSNLLGDTLGITLPGTGSGADGVSGGLNALTDGLSDGTAGTPLEPLINPLSDTLAGTGTDLTGVTSALADVGAALGADNSPLAPLTADLLAPVVGTGPADATDLLGAAGDPTGIASGAGLPGLDALTNLLPA